jgi:hypothetical protein
MVGYARDDRHLHNRNRGKILVSMALAAIKSQVFWTQRNIGVIFIIIIYR